METVWRYGHTTLSLAIAIMGVARAGEMQLQRRGDGTPSTQAHAVQAVIFLNVSLFERVSVCVCVCVGVTLTLKRPPLCAVRFRYWSADGNPLCAELRRWCGDVKVPGTFQYNAFNLHVEAHRICTTQKWKWSADRQTQRMKHIHILSKRQWQLERDRARERERARHNQNPARTATKYTPTSKGTACSLCVTEPYKTQLKRMKRIRIRRTIHIS